MKKTVLAWVAASLATPALLVGQQPNAPAPQRTGVTPRPAAAVAAQVAFPAVDRRNFTAASPTVAEVDSFLKALWGYDPDRIWSVTGIYATPAQGVSRIVVLVSEKTQPGRQSQTVFFTTPDGKHAIADGVIGFGPKPFAEAREILQARANGPARGATGNELLLVLFSDLQCARCGEAQETLESLAQEFPKARIVFQDYPAADLHPYAFRAAAEGVCVRKAKGDEAFFTYAQAVLASQAKLTKADADATLAAAVTKAGGDATAAAECANAPATQEAVDASRKLGADLGVADAPTLAVNGHLLPLGVVPYEVLKRMVVYQANQDGVPLILQPSLRTLK